MGNGPKSPGTSTSSTTTLNNQISTASSSGSAAARSRTTAIHHRRGAAYGQNACRIRPRGTAGAWAAARSDGPRDPSDRLTGLSVTGAGARTGAGAGVGAGVGARGPGAGTVTAATATSWRVSDESHGGTSLSGTGGPGVLDPAGPSACRSRR